MLIGFTVLLTLSIFFLKNKETVGMVLSAGILIPLAWLLKKRMGNEDRKILKELKEKLAPTT